mgnify:CR=1 FL=1
MIRASIWEAYLAQGLSTHGAARARSSYCPVVPRSLGAEGTLVFALTCVQARTPQLAVIDVRRDVVASGLPLHVE